MGKKPDGGPAFPLCVPRVPGVQEGGHVFGMTLRDYFAAHATDTDIASMRDKVPMTERVLEYAFGSKRAELCLPENWRQIARWLHADAMLAERDKP